ncbi:MAG TPA: GAF domain-containing protein [Acidimicrobiales bacterium]
MEEWDRLLKELRKEFILREDELEFLHEIDMQLLQSERPLTDTFDFIVEKTQELMKSDRTAILLRRGTRLETAYSVDRTILGQHIDLATSLTGQALLTATTMNVPDVTAAPYAGKYIPIEGYTGPPLKSLLCTPIQVHQTMVGVLSTESTRTAAFTNVHERIINNIGGQVAIALQRAQLFDQYELFSEVDRLIFEPPSESSHAISVALQKVMDALREVEHIELSRADILFPRGHGLEVVHSTNPAAVGVVLPVDKSICGRAARERKTQTIGDVRTEAEYRSPLGTSIRSEIAIPILVGDSKVVVGVLNVESEEPNAFEGFCQVLLESFASKVRTLLAFAKLRSDVTETMELRNASDVLVAIGDQASNMIHRMNNTVGAMRVRIIELQEHSEKPELSGDEVLADHLAALRKLAERTLQLPEEVARLLNQQGVTVNVNEVVRSAITKFKPDIPDDVAVETAFDESVPLLSLYSFDIVVQNLIQNALEAMPNGGTLSVSTRSVTYPELAGGYVELAVKDTGVGISDEVLPKLFELNFSTKRSKGQGHGLGLWWIRNFVLRAKGDLNVSSSENQGAEFVVRIPVDIAPDDAVAS